MDCISFTKITRLSLEVSWQAELLDLLCNDELSIQVYFVSYNLACELIKSRGVEVFFPQRPMHKESLQNIKKLHCMLEILCLSRERLALSVAEQEIQTQKMIEYFLKNPLNWNRTFHFDIPMNIISPTLNG